MSTKRLLIIEDEEDIREIVGVSLETLGGWEILAAGSGAEGIARAAEEHPDAILLDVMMPGMDGPATLERLRSDPATREIPVVFLTAKVQASDRERLKGLGAAGVITKPFDPVALPGEVADALSWS